MHKLLYVFVVIFVSVIIVRADSEITPTQQCQGVHFEGLRERIQIKPCSKDMCKLTKQENTTVIIKFKSGYSVFYALRHYNMMTPKTSTPEENSHEEKDVDNLTNNVSAVLMRVPLPFVGVHGTSACDQIVHAEDGTPASCPLKAGVEYIYTNVFYIHPIYPETNLKVHWSLDDGPNPVICFEVSAVIVKAKKKSH